MPSSDSEDDEAPKLVASSRESEQTASSSLESSSKDALSAMTDAWPEDPHEHAPRLERRRPKRRRHLVVASVIFVATLAAITGYAALAHRDGLHRVLADIPFVHSTASAGTQLDSSTFAGGACMAFGPTSGDNHKTVFLDAGHGGIDPGGIGTTESGQSISESNVNLGIELDMMATLRSRGYRVVVSRTRDSTVAKLNAADRADGVLSLEGSHNDVAARAVCANLAKADVLVGIYMDTGSSAQDGGSVSLYDADRLFSAANLRLAGLLQTDVLTAMNANGWQIPDDGVLPDSGFGSLVGDSSAGGLAAEAAAYNHLMLIGPSMTGFFSTPSEMPGAVLEPLYLTDSFEGSIAASSADQHVIATAMSDAVEQFLTPTKGSG